MVAITNYCQWTMNLNLIAAAVAILCFISSTVTAVSEYSGAMIAPAEPFVISFDGSPVDQNQGTSVRGKRNARWRPLLVRSMPPNGQMQEFLLQKHNYYRSLVPATNMRYMYWSPHLAASAQRHANTCDFNHSRNRRNTGENIWTAPYSNYKEAVWLWYREVDPKYGCQCPHHYKHCCGHYTQVVWADSYQMGCGAARCRDVQGVFGMGMRYVLVCHYNPSGNTLVRTPTGTYALPAFKWQRAGLKGCSECDKRLKNCSNGKLCY